MVVREEKRSGGTNLLTIKCNGLVLEKVSKAALYWSCLDAQLHRWTSFFLGFFAFLFFRVIRLKLSGLGWKRIGNGNVFDLDMLI